MNTRLIKILLLVILAIYVISPVDLCPGPVDDIIFILLYLAGNKRSLEIEKKTSDIEVIDTDGTRIV
jgi:hypothetical protein